MPTYRIQRPLDRLRSSVPIPTGRLDVFAPMVRHSPVYVGVYTVYGTVKEKNTPENTPLARKVWLIQERGMQVAGVTWSRASDGAYAFERVPAGVYSTVTYDYKGNYKAEIDSGLVAERMVL